MLEKINAIINIVANMASGIFRAKADKSYIVEYHPAYDLEIGERCPTLFLFGGSEGGMVFGVETDEVERLRKTGFNVASVAYFAYDGLTPVLSRIDLDAFAKHLDEISSRDEVDSERLGLVGVSKGAELSLMLASKYSQIHSVVAIVPSHVSFQASEITLFAHSSWISGGEEVPFVPFPRFSLSTIKGVLDGVSYRQMHLEALQNKNSVEKARIKVEDINGSILLVSAREDQMWPSTEMSDEIMERLDAAKFTNPYKHIPLQHDHFVLQDDQAWQIVVDFLINESGLK